jgi:ubiquinone/menaquinone biosynthesis C-methylase UbiE
MRETFWQTIGTIVGPATKEDFDEVGQKETRNAFERFILENSTPSTRLLDAGCSTGIEGFRLYQKGYTGSYVGIDSNRKAIHLALENLYGHPASLALSDLEATGFPDGYFDIVLTKDVIEHAPSYRAILRELARLSRSWLILSMFIRMQDDPSVIREDPPGLFHNRYQRAELVEFMSTLGMESPVTLFTAGDDEVLLFKKSAYQEK